VSSRGPPPELPLYRLLVIVRRGETNVYAQLAVELQRLSPRMPVEVIWDRSQAERRAHVRPVAVDWRSGDRRQPVLAMWTTWGFVVATVRR
jgi:hypothetical protein